MKLSGIAKGLGKVLWGLSKKLDEAGLWFAKGVGRASWGAGKHAVNKAKGLPENGLFIFGLLLVGAALCVTMPLLGIATLFGAHALARRAQNKELIAQGLPPKPGKIKKLSAFLRKSFFPDKPKKNLPKVKILPPPTPEEKAQMDAQRTIRGTFEGNARRRRHLAFEQGIRPHSGPVMPTPAPTPSGP